MAVKLIDELQKEIKAASEAVTQEAYEKAYDHVFQILDNLEKLLNDNRYLEGNEITEEDNLLQIKRSLLGCIQFLLRSNGSVGRKTGEPEILIRRLCNRQ